MPNTANTAGGRYSQCIERRQWGTNCMLVRSVIPRWVGEQTHSYCRCITSVYTHRLARPYISSRYARTMALIRDCWWCGYYRAETEGWLGLAMVNGATAARGGYHRFLIPRGAHPRFLHPPPLVFSLQKHKLFSLPFEHRFLRGYSFPRACFRWSLSRTKRLQQSEDLRRFGNGVVNGE